MAGAALWKKTQEYLEKESGLKVYPPFTKNGQCTEDYLVLKDDSSSSYGNLSTDINYYDILCYSKKYTSVLALADRIREIMKRYAPQMHPTGVETGAFFDDDINAFMISMQYRAMRRDKKVKQYY